ARRTRLGKALERVKQMVGLIASVRFCVSTADKIGCRAVEHTALRCITRQVRNQPSELMHHPLAIGIEDPQFAEPIKILSKFLIFPPVKLRPLKSIRWNKQCPG